MRRILITGGRGQLGSEIARCLQLGKAEIGPISECYAGAQVDAVDRDSLDISDEAAVESWYVGHGPYDLVINCAAMTDVDGCERDVESAYLLNGTAVGYLAAAAERQYAKFVQVSTDYVFAGDEPAPRVEDDIPTPKSAYGKSKLLGEQSALRCCSKAFVVRTSWLYGRAGKNFVKTMLRLGASRDSVTVVDDQVGNPTYANDLAYEILKIAATESYGIYHCTGEGVCSWADFAQEIMSLAGLPCEVRRCSSDEYRAANPQTAQRPHYSALENARLAATIGNEMRSWKVALGSFMKSEGLAKA